MALGLPSVYGNTARSPLLPQMGGAPAGGAGGGDINQYSRVLDYINHLLGQGGASGAFGPDYLRNFMRKRAIATYGNQQNRGRTLAGLAGLDPMQQRAALFQGEQQASGGLSDTLNNADLSGAQNYQQMLMQLLGQRFEQENQYKRDEAAKAERNRGGIGGFLGQVAGSLIPSFIPHPGAGGNSRTQTPDYNDPRYGWGATR